MTLAHIILVSSFDSSSVVVVLVPTPGSQSSLCRRTASSSFKPESIVSGYQTPVFFLVSTTYFFSCHNSSATLSDYLDTAPLDAASVSSPRSS